MDADKSPGFILEVIESNVVLSGIVLLLVLLVDEVPEVVMRSVDNPVVNKL